MLRTWARAAGEVEQEAPKAPARSWADRGCSPSAEYLLLPFPAWSEAAASPVRGPHPSWPQRLSVEPLPTRGGRPEAGR